MQWRKTIQQNDGSQGEYHQKLLPSQERRRQEDLQAQAERKKKMTKRLVIVTLVTACILAMLSFAWYSYLSHRNITSEERDVMPPYYLYLVDANGTDALNLTVGNLHPGETKQIVVGVSNQAPKGESETSYKVGKDSSFNYELELAYTKNLPVTYNVYELKKTDATESAQDMVTLEWMGDNNEIVRQNFNKTGLTKINDSTAISKKNNEEMYGEENVNIINLGQYDIYDNTSGASFDLTTKINNGEVTFDLDYYMIEIKWNEGIDFSEYLKETDLVYVIVKAMQLEPKE